jgi:hypothetical protein
MMYKAFRGWIELHKKEFCDDCISQSITGTIKSTRIMIWTGHVARMREERIAYKLVGKI